MPGKFFDTDAMSDKAPVKVAAVDFELPTAPMPIDLMPSAGQSPAQRREESLSIVSHHHSRIANTIRTLWGYPECGTYINKLVMAGGDGMGQSRVGFNQDAVQAMLALSDLHDGQFGAPETDLGLGFSQSVHLR